MLHISRRQVKLLKLRVTSRNKLRTCQLLRLIKTVTLFRFVQTITNASSQINNQLHLQLLNNQAYDPTLYQSFVPQDAVQAYVSQYGNGFAGQALEGFLIPTLKHTEIAPFAPTFVSVMKSFLPGPKILFAVLAKFVALAASAIGIVFFGGAITSFVCAFTPLCTITFVGSPLSMLRKETKDIVEKIGTEITADRIKRATDLFKLAIDKYQQMQKP